MRTTWILPASSALLFSEIHWTSNRPPRVHARKPTDLSSGMPATRCIAGGGRACNLEAGCVPGGPGGPVAGRCWPGGDGPGGPGRGAPAGTGTRRGATPGGNVPGGCPGAGGPGRTGAPPKRGPSAGAPPGGPGGAPGRAPGGGGAAAGLGPVAVGGLCESLAGGTWIEHFGLWSEETDVIVQ